MANYGKLKVIDTVRSNLGKILGYTAGGYTLFLAHRAEKQGLTNASKLLRTIGGIGLAGTALTSLAQYDTGVRFGFEKGCKPSYYARGINGIARGLIEEAEKTTE